jgi:hypothetical protein
MTTLTELRERIYRVIADPSASQFSSDLVDDGIRAALEAVLPWVFKKSVETFDGDGVEASYDLPEDCYRVVAVFDESSGTYIPQNTMSANTSPGENIVSNQDWMEYPHGEISFANPIEDGKTITVHYGAIWEAPVDDDDDIEAPTWLHRALVYYAASYALLEKASSSSNIRQWNVQIDSGTPIMNPMRDMSTYFLERFRIEMERVPAVAKGTYG